MTMILVLGNCDQVVQFSDRRLSNAGRPLDEESNKCGVLVCENARLSFGYTGIGRLRQFRTMDWLVGALAQCGPPYDIGPILEQLRARATEEFQSNAVLRSVKDKPLTVLFSGYINLDGAPKAAYAFLSNCVDYHTGHRFESVQSEFRVYYFSRRPLQGEEDSSFVQRVGNWTGITKADMADLLSMLARRPAATGVANYGIRFLRELADRQASGGTIGKQIETISISSDWTKPMECGYHSNVVQRSAFVPASVCLLPDRKMAVHNVTITPEDADTPPLSVPRVSNNAPCPCNSGLRYRKCHGKRRGAEQQAQTFLLQFTA